ncbi:MAG: hypothetical protein GXN99_00970 [Candidatus Nanohaloarchaeota archaeon]|nr:hypothetical protein [Candidatus Nanohaloarchaeota archaeon]
MGSSNEERVFIASEKDEQFIPPEVIYIFDPVNFVSFQNLLRMNKYKEDNKSDILSYLKLPVAVDVVEIGGMLDPFFYLTVVLYNKFKNKPLTHIFFKPSANIFKFIIRMIYSKYRPYEIRVDEKSNDELVVAEVHPAYKYL